MGGAGGEEGGGTCIKTYIAHTIEIMNVTLKRDGSSRLARVLTGVFIAQVVGKAAITYLLPHDPAHPETLVSATYHALWSTAYQDATLMPAAIALLRNTKTAS